MSRSAFERIPLSAAEHRESLDREHGQMRAWLRSARTGSGLTVRTYSNVSDAAIDWSHARPTWT